MNAKHILQIGGAILAILIGIKIGHRVVGAISTAQVGATSSVALTPGATAGGGAAMQ